MVPYLLTIFFFINPPLIQEYFQGLLCIPLSEDYPDAIFFQYDISQSCSTDGQKIRFGGLIGLGWWCSGFPMFLALYLRRRIFDLHEPSLSTALGLLYNGYEEHYYWWEVVVFIRKLAVLGCFIVPMRTNLSKITDLLCVGMISLGLHLYAQPYDNRYYFLLDRLETKMLWAFVFTMVCGLHLRIRGLYPMPEGGWPKDYTDPKYLEDQIIKYAIVISHLRFVLHFLFFVSYEFFLKNNPCFQDGRVQYDPAIKEFDVSKLSSKERGFLAACFVESMTAHVEDLKWFTFRYIEAAWKESLYEILHDRAVRKKALDELLGRSPKSGDGSASPTGKDAKKKNPVLKVLKALKTLICGAGKKKKKKGSKAASAADLDENIEVDWGERISLEKIQLGMLRHNQFPVDTFRKDLQRGKAKSTLIGIDMIDPKTGLSLRCVNVKTRAEKAKEDAERRSLKNRIKEALDTPAKKEARAKAEADREYYQNLFGTENVEPEGDAWNAFCVRELGENYEKKASADSMKDAAAKYRDLSESDMDDLMVMAEGLKYSSAAQFSDKKKKEQEQQKKGVWKPEEWIKPTVDPSGDAQVAGLGGPRSVTTLDYIQSMVASFDRRHGGVEFVLPEEITPTTGLELEDAAAAPGAEDEPAELTGDEDPLLVAPPADDGAGVGLEDEPEQPAEKPPEEPPAIEESLPHTSAETSGAGDPLALLKEEEPATEAPATEAAAVAAAVAAENAATEAETPAPAAPPAEEAPAAPETEATEAKDGDPEAAASKPAETADGDGDAKADAPLPAPAIEVPPAAEPAKS
jgi:hypothetical protein